MWKRRAVEIRENELAEFRVMPGNAVTVNSERCEKNRGEEKPFHSEK
jgi:hypothetical protein